MTPKDALNLAVRPSLRWMGAPFDSVDASRMILAAALQESGLRTRHQIGGPAHGGTQFEIIGAAEAIRVDDLLGKHFLKRLGLPRDPEGLHRALEWSEIGMVVCSRLLLWPHPKALPSAGEQYEGWEQYYDRWKPGKPHPERWAASWAGACEAVSFDEGGWW